MKSAARLEGLMLDLVYTAKVFAAIPALVQSGDIPKGSKVLFIHTGGLAALFAYQTDLDRGLRQGLVAHALLAQHARLPH